MTTLTCVGCGKTATYPDTQMVNGKPILDWFLQDRKERCRDCQAPLLPFDAPEIFKFAQDLHRHNIQTLTLDGQSAHPVHNANYSYIDIGGKHWMTQNMAKPSSNTKDIQQAAKEGVIKQIVWGTQNGRYCDRIDIEYTDEHVRASHQNLPSDEIIEHWSN